jgi:hypothetical protein
MINQKFKFLLIPFCLFIVFIFLFNLDLFKTNKTVLAQSKTKVTVHKFNLPEEVTSFPLGIKCGTTCEADFGPGNLVLTVTPEKWKTIYWIVGNDFGNTCPQTTRRGEKISCQFNVSGKEPINVYVFGTPVETNELRVKIWKATNKDISPIRAYSLPVGINCFENNESGCNSDFPQGMKITLIAEKVDPDNKPMNVEWSASDGVILGNKFFGCPTARGIYQKANCEVIVPATLSTGLVTVKYYAADEQPPTPKKVPLTVIKTGDFPENETRVESEDKNKKIFCGERCTADYYPGDKVLFYATYLKFEKARIRWSGDNINCQEALASYESYCMIEIGDKPMTVYVDFSKPPIIGVIRVSVFMDSYNPIGTFSRSHIARIENAEVQFLDLDNNKIINEDLTNEDGEVSSGYFPIEKQNKKIKIKVAKEGFKEFEKIIDIKVNEGDEKIFQKIPILLKPDKNKTSIYGVALQESNQQNSLNLKPLSGILVTVDAPTATKTIETYTNHGGFFYTDLQSFIEKGVKEIRISAKSKDLRFEDYEKNIKLPDQGGIIGPLQIRFKPKKEKGNYYSQVLEFRNKKDDSLIIGQPLEVEAKVGGPGGRIIDEGTTETGRLEIKNIPYLSDEIMVRISSDKVEYIPIIDHFYPNPSKIKIIHLEPIKYECSRDYHPNIEICFESEKSLKLSKNSSYQKFFKYLAEAFHNIKNRLRINMPNRLIISDIYDPYNAFAFSKAIVIGPDYLEKEVFKNNDPLRRSSSLLSHELTHILDDQRGRLSYYPEFVNYWLNLPLNLIKNLISAENYINKNDHPQSNPAELFATYGDDILNFHQEFHKLSQKLYQ